MKWFNLVVVILAVYGWVLIFKFDDTLGWGLMLIMIGFSNAQIDKANKSDQRIKDLEETLIPPKVIIYDFRWYICTTYNKFG